MSGILTNIKRYIAENIDNGSTLVPKHIREKRQDICYGRNGHDKCNEIDESGYDAECGLCGCFIDVKTAHETHLLEGLRKGKLKREKVKCPLGKWEKYFKNLEKELNKNE